MDEQKTLLKVIFYIVAIVLTLLIVMSSNEGESTYRDVTMHLTICRNISRTFNNAVEGLTFGLYSKGSEENDEIKRLASSGAAALSTANVAGWLLFIMSGASLIVLRQANLRMGLAGAKDTYYHALWVTALFLVVGLLAPILTMTAVKEIPVIGTVVVKYETKSIIGSIGVLFSSGNVPVGLLILAFSVCTPLVKLGLALLVLRTSSEKLRGRYMTFIKKIGKWSMADVFVVAILLAFFVMKNVDELIDAGLGIGFYFFALYCLLSMVIATRMVKFEEDPIESTRCQEHQESERVQ